MFLSASKVFKAAVISSTLTLGACAEYPSRIAPAYIPSIVYSGASCAEIDREQVRLAHYVETLTGIQNKTADNDTAAVLIASILYAPALAVVPLTVDQSAQLAVARGHYNALITASRTKGCSSGYVTSAPNPANYRGGRLYSGDLPPM
ncbi:hypothetical protein U5922_017635 [Aquicoccus sp. G2-2]|uniref:hypothetical protein n=1 Tax=Aquicoccus sp. G2-2 TaxID=3092120 RepID=UPI002ADF95B8|nr:hypothetical protein [Aquicoccus sp. G2-2]MEA1115200.1 hypothetical protein [Aquicoccus sp. G2-2]